MSSFARMVALLVAGASATTVTAPSAPPEPVTPEGYGLAEKKGPAVDDETDPPMLGTLVQVHTGERAVLDEASPNQAEFDAMLADRATGDGKGLDPRLLGLLRTLAAAHPGSRIELVSGYRSWKLNEMLRKKGHHVASHSQHSLGHACDFRIVPPGSDVGIDPRVLEAEIRKLGWEGGVGVYPTKADWFVHADVGRKRGWVN